MIVIDLSSCLLVYRPAVLIFDTIVRECSRILTHTIGIEFSLYIILRLHCTGRTPYRFVFSEYKTEIIFTGMETSDFFCFLFFFFTVVSTGCCVLIRSRPLLTDAFACL